MSEWIGWVSRLRRRLYSRMEELSFRTGTATIAGVLAVAATAILLTLIQAGHHAVPRSVQAGAAPAAPAVAQPMHAYSPPATHSAHRKRTEAPFADYVPGPAKTRAAAPRAAPSPTPLWPRPTLWGPKPGTSTTPPNQTPFPWPWPTPGPTQPFLGNQPGGQGLAPNSPGQ